MTIKILQLNITIIQKAKKFLKKAQKDFSIKD